MAFAALAGCTDVCANTPHKIADSPDGSMKAILFDRDCGATAGFTTQLSIVAAGESPQGSGNVFIADGGLKAAAWGGPWADVRWLGPKHLLVEYDAGARTFLENKMLGDVRVSFEALRR